MCAVNREKPTAELVKHLMSREPVPGDRFVTSVLSCWLSQQYDDVGKKLGDLIGSQLCKQVSHWQSCRNSRKRWNAEIFCTDLSANFQICSLNFAISSKIGLIRKPVLSKNGQLFRKIISLVPSSVNTKQVSHWLSALQTLTR